MEEETEVEGLAEAIKLIQETACRAEAAQVLTIDDPDNYHIRIGQEIRTIARPAQSRRHSVLDVPTFIGTVEAFGEGGVSVWHCHGQIVAILGDETRRDRVTLELSESSRFHALLELDGKLLDQRSFCSALNLRLGIDESFIGQFRRLDWRSEKNVAGTAARGQDRMGVSLSDEVNGVADLADEVTLEMPVYDLAACPWLYKIPCHIEIDAQQTKLGIVTKPDAIKTAIDQAQHDIHELLVNGLEDGHPADVVVPVFYGSPN